MRTYFHLNESIRKSPESKNQTHLSQEIKCDYFLTTATIVFCFILSVLKKRLIIVAKYKLFSKKINFAIKT